MDNNPDDKVGDDYPDDKAGHEDAATQPFPFMPAGAEKTLKKVFGLDEEEEGAEVPPNPHRHEPDNKPS